MRSSINELWMGDVKVACGVVGETTKVFLYDFYHGVILLRSTWSKVDSLIFMGTSLLKGGSL